MSDLFMLKTLMMQLREAVNDGDSRGMIMYNLGRVHGASYSDPYSSDSVTAIRNEAQYLAHNYAYRHGRKSNAQ